MEWISEIVTDNIPGIIIGIIIGLGIAGILSFLKTIPRIFKFLLKYKKELPTKFKKLKKWIAYRRTIGQIERLEIRVIPEGFMDDKSPEKNPELRKIYRMIDDRVLTRPLTKEERFDEYFKDNPIKLKLNLDALLGHRIKIPDIRMPNLRPPNLPR